MLTITKAPLAVFEVWGFGQSSCSPKLHSSNHKVVTHTTTQRNLRNMVLSGRGQRQGASLYDSSYMKHSEQVTLKEAESG